MDRDRKYHFTQVLVFRQSLFLFGLDGEQGECTFWLTEHPCPFYKKGRLGGDVTVWVAMV
jgi:hypothetical protein